MRLGFANGVLAFTASLGCTAAALQGNDAGGAAGFDAAQDRGGDVVADTAPPDATSAPDTGRDSMIETAPPITGRRSFVVSSTVTIERNTGTQQPGPPVPAQHVFTMVLDWDAGIAIVGSAEGGGVVALNRLPGGGTIGGLSFTFGNTTLAYASIEIAVDGAQAVSGTGRGGATCYSLVTDVGTCSADVTMSLAGVPDTQPPALIADIVDGSQIDPFSGLTLVASEPLPPDTHLSLVDLRGNPVAITAPADQTMAAFRFYPNAGKTWRYDDRYTLMVDGIVDFAGNPALPGGAVTFTTGAPPPLVSEDGFESAAGTTLAGAQVLAGAGAPVISGARSLYIPSFTTPSGTYRAEITQLALRLTLDPGDTVLRFAYRVVNPSVGGTLEPYYLAASEGGQIISRTLSSGSAPPVMAMIPGQGEVSLGPIMTAEIPLPPDAAGELILLRKVGACCAGLQPYMTGAGIIIDDLRAE